MKPIVSMAGVFAAAFFFACSPNNPNEFTVTGVIKNATPGTVYLEQGSLSNTQPVIVDSAKMDKDGSFRLTGTGKEEGIYFLQLAGNAYPFAILINDAKKISVTATPDDAYTVSGSPASSRLNDYQKSSIQKAEAIYKLTARIDSLTRSGAADSIITPLKSEQAILAAAFKEDAVATVTNSNSPSFSVFAIGAYQSVALNPAIGAMPLSETEMTDIVNRTAAKFPNNQGVVDFKKNLAQLLPRSSSPGPVMWMNKPAPDFTLPATNGSAVSLSSLRGKYVLVDFWASWCRPCRAENPNVVKAYQKFKDKNFTVLGVSLDQEKTDWLDAIKQDNLTWTHVSDLKFWESKVVPLYNIEGIPYNVLVDPNGTVIGEGLRGEELEKKLQEVLK